MSNQEIGTKLASEWAILQSMPMPMLVSNLAGNAIFANQRISDLIGIPLDQIIGFATPDFYANTEDRNTVLTLIQEHGYLENYELPIKKLDGAQLWVLLSVQQIEYDDQPAFLSVLVDITKQKEAESAMQASEDRFKTIYEGSNDAIMLLTPEGFFDCNHQTLELFGFDSVEEFTQVHPADISPPYQPNGQESFPAAQERIKTAYEKGHNRFEWVHRRTNGEDFDAEVLLSAFELQGKTVLQATVRDISERKQAGRALEQSEHLLQSFINNFPDGVWAKDREGRFVLANRYIVDEIAGTEVIGKTVYDTMPKENADFVWASEKRLLENGQSIAVEEDVPHADGKIYQKLTTKFPIYDTEGNIAGVGGILFDLTDRKKAEEALRENEDRFRRFTEATAEGLVFHEDGTIIDANPAAMAMFGFSDIAELLGRNLLKFVLPEYHQLVLEKMRLESVQPYRIEGIHKDGHTFPIETSTRTYELGGKIIRATSVRNITERQRVEQQIAIFQALVENSADAITMSDLNGDISFANRAAYELLGFDYETQELIGKPTNTLASAHERERQGQAIGQIMATKSGWSDEATALRSDGTEVDVAITMFPVMGANAQPAYIAAILRDISKQKQDQQALTESQRLLQLVLDNIPQAVFWKNKDLAYLGTNQAFAEDAGLDSPDLMIGKTDFDMPWKEQAELYRADDRKVMEAGEAQLNYEEPQTGPTGEITWLRTSKIPMTDNEGKVFAVLGMYEDITAQKQAEEQLRQEKALSDAVINGLPGIFYLFTPDGSMVRWNEEYERVVGYSSEELASRNALDAIAPEDKETTYAAIERVFQEGQAEVEAHVITRDGRLIPYYFAGRRLQIENQLYVAGTGLDISDRKRLEIQVREAFERRGYQVQISTEISQEIAAVSELSELFDRVVTLTKERLGYYHTQLLHYEPTQDAVVLISGYGETGRKMMAQGHRMPMGSGLIGTAAESGETMMRPDLTADPDWQPNPLLPETKGEIAVPIKLGDQILGVLDIQSNQAGALTKDDQLMLEGLCGQIAIAMDQTRLRQEMEERLTEINRLYRAMSREGWESYTSTTALPEGFQYDQAGVRQLDKTEGQEPLVSKPLMVPGGTVVGTLAIADNPRNPLSAEDQAFLEQVSEQVALALESARLFEQTQSALEAVQASQEQLSEALEIAKLGYWEFDVANDEFILTDNFYSIFHTTAEKMGGYRMSSKDYSEKFVYPDDSAMVGEEIGRALAVTDLHFSTQVEHRILYQDGGVGYISVNINLERDVEGNILRWWGANQDITERWLAFNAVRESEDQLGEALEIAKLGNFEYDVEKDVFTFNDHFYAIFHTTAEEVGGYQMASMDYASKFVYPEDMDMVGEEIGKALSSTDRHYNAQIEHRILYADGGIGYISVNVHVERDEDGNIIRYYGANQDITERKLAEEAVRQAQERAQTILETVTIPMVITRLSDNILTFANQPAAALIGLAIDEFVNQPSPNFYYRPEERQLFIQELQENGFVNNMQMQLVKQSGEPFWALISARVFNYQGEASVLSTVLDISDRIKAQEATAKRAVELATVAEIGTTISTLLEEQQLLETVVQQTREHFNLYHCHIFLADANNQILQVKACGWHDDSPHQGIVEQALIHTDQEQSLVARAARDQRAVIVNDVRKDPNWLPNELLPETRSEMAIPLIAGNQVLGVLDVQAAETERFTEEDISIMATLASQAAVALQNARTYAQTQQQAEYEAMINQISQRIQSTTSVENALQVAIRELGRALGAKRANVQLGLPNQKK